MPFGICSVPEVFQHGTHELIEGSHGTEVLQDTSLLLGLEEATSVMQESGCIPTVMRRRMDQIEYGQGTTQEAGAFIGNVATE